MPKLTIDGRTVTVPEGATLLDAARKLDVRIPTLCHMRGLEPAGSCMVCLVEDLRNGRFIPACSARAEEGMRIQTDGREVRRLRREAVELLLSDHAGDCVAPCERGCPARPDIPAVLRALADGNVEEAVEICLHRIALPAVLGAVCPAPCEKVCRRRQHDAPVSIRRLMHFAGRLRLAREVETDRGGCGSAGGESSVRRVDIGRVAVVGAGPAGLSASYTLRRLGCGCTLFEREPRPGGGLRRAEGLPQSLLEEEIRRLLAAGVTLETNRTLGVDLDLAELMSEHDAVVLALGPMDGEEKRSLGVPADGETDLPAPVFLCGGMVRPSRMAVRAVAQGREAALRVEQMLRGDEAIGRGDAGIREEPVRFDFHLGKLLPGELEELLHGASDAPPVIACGDTGDVSLREAAAEARRCLRCDCGARADCRLRELAERFGAATSRGRRARGDAAGTSAVPARRRFRRILEHPDILYEPGKCIQCGRCIRIARAEGEELGLAFQGRGFEVRVGVPFGGSLAEGLRKAALKCAAACPTGAMVPVDRRRETHG